MTQDEIIEMAIQAGASPDENKIWLMYAEEIETFAKLVAAKEREALAQEQEPVAWMYQEYRDDDQFGWRDEILFTPPPNDPIYFRNITPVYTHPPQRTEQEPVKIVQYNCKCGRTMKFESVHGVVAPQRTWVGLTDEEIDSCFEDHGWSPSKDYYPVIKDIEAKLKERNT